MTEPPKTEEIQAREYLNARQLAEFLGCSRATIYRYAQGRGVPESMPSIKLTRNKLMFDLARVREWLDRIGGFPENDASLPEGLLNPEEKS